MATPDWQAVPNGVLDQEKQQDDAQQWGDNQRAQIAQQWGDQQRLAVAPVSPPARDDWATGGTSPAPPFAQPAADDGSASTLPPSAAPAAGDIPQAAPAAAAAPAPARSDGAPPTSGSGKFSPYDDVFARHAGDLADNPEFLSIVAAGTLAESSWNTNSTTGDGGHSWGLFQMHDGGAGAGMGQARLDPDAASAVMVPRYAAAYKAAKAQNPNLTGPALAARVAQAAERSADESGSAYAAAYRTIMGGKAPNVIDSAQQWLGDRASDVGNAVSGAVNAASNLGKSDTPGPAIQGDYTSALPGGTQDPVQAGSQALEDVRRTALGPGIADPEHPLNVVGEPATIEQLSHIAPAIAGMGSGGGTGGAAKTGADILQAALSDLGKYGDEVSAPIKAWADQAQKAGGSASDIGATIQKWMRENPLGETAAPATEAAPATSGILDQAHQAMGRLDAGDQSALNDLHQLDQQMNGNGAPPPAAATVSPGSPPTGAAAPTTGTTPPAGASGWPTTPPPAVPMGAPPVVPPAGGGLPPTPSAASMPKGIPQQAMQALREYAAAVGPDSNAALVDAQQTQRLAGQAGTQVNIGPMTQANKDAARQVLDQKLAALGVQNDPQVTKFISNVETPSTVPDMPILGGLQAAQNEVKGVLFPLSMFHSYTEGLYSTFSRPSGAADFAAAFFSKSPTEAAQNTPMWLRAAQAGVTHLVDTSAFDAPGVSAGLKGAGMRAAIGGVGGSAAGYSETKIAGGDDEQARQNALIYGLVGAGGAAAAKPLISDNLWRAVQYSKVKTFETLVNSGVEDQVAASAVNRTFGGLNYAQMGRSQTFQDLLRLTIQAPDWGEGTVRQLGSALFGGSNPGAGFSRDLIARTVTATALATGILNMVFNGKPVADDPAHMFQVQLPSGTAAKSVYIGIGPGNLQAYADLAAKIAKDPSQTLQGTYTSGGQVHRQPGDIPQFLLNREAAIPAAIGDVASGGATTFGGTRAPLAAEALSRGAPVSVSTAVQAQENKMDPRIEAILLAAGANPRYGSASALRGTRSNRNQSEPGPLDFLTKLFTTGDSGRPVRPKR